MIAFRVKLSRLRITEKKAIVLEDFDHREVKMDTLTKAVFLLYLKHPRGYATRNSLTISRNLRKYIH